MKVSLHTSALSTQTRGAVVLPWLENVAQSAAQRPLATAVLVPLRADAYHLKSIALGAGIGLCGVHFLTPGALRDRLGRRLAPGARARALQHRLV